MLPDRVSNPGPLTYGSGVLPTALRGPAAVSTDAVSVVCIDVVSGLPVMSAICAVM